MVDYKGEIVRSPVAVDRITSEAPATGGVLLE
jgi:hypothetical protein